MPGAPSSDARMARCGQSVVGMPERRQRLLSREPQRRVAHPTVGIRTCLTVVDATSAQMAREELTADCDARDAASELHHSSLAALLRRHAGATVATRS